MARSGKHSRAKDGAHRGASESGKPTYREWVWWPNQEGQRSRAREEFEKHIPKGVVRGEMAKRIQRFMAGESRFKDVDDLGDGIKELRYRHGNNHYRVLFCIDGDTCVALTCFYKNQNKTPKADRDRAKQRKRSYGGG